MDISNPKARSTLVAQILGMVDYKKSCRISGQSFGFPLQGQMVITGPQLSQDQEKRMGFCVQVRKGCGQFGSDMVFLRHPDGSLTTHENQAYFGMTDRQIELARPLFDSLPEDEDYTQGYTCCDKIHEVGFLIGDSKSRPSRNASFTLTVDSTDESGNPSKQIFTHI